jgi:hypothetical protein
MRAVDRRSVRDGLFAAGLIVNLAKVGGSEVLLDHAEERKPTSLYAATDATIRHLRPEWDAAGTQMGLAGVEGVAPVLRPASCVLRPGL